MEYAGITQATFSTQRITFNIMRCRINYSMSNKTCLSPDGNLVTTLLKSELLKKASVTEKKAEETSGAELSSAELQDGNFNALLNSHIGDICRQIHVWKR